ncbi:DNA mismatch endonuclease Vsr [Kaustia mangrovi]|uniref:Very short patch repair endonuclease n=1 Tax=Kaustia mangrovi TaxID=2593653 RepID=A0A7S8C865_9HYPH|nr:very short patch repair endonuclease [Kaustia mangrovi]QPC45034.1 DNA mismatch endonuclease Vsr [Kaustia mangrovi]
MPDIVDRETRSRMMSGIRGANTKPELQIRKALHALGFRYRLHARDVPGKPDIVLPRYRAVIFVNGCFWHGHDCPLFRLPGTRREFWENKIRTNRERDAKVRSQLGESNWRHLTIWECALKGPQRLGLEKTVAAAVDWIRGEEEAGEIRGQS